ncbi:MAG: radical SAM protein [Azospirillaceae bacterium]|nr:radical SAM protein [Azospirillaceae bacterium]
MSEQQDDQEVQRRRDRLRALPLPFPSAGWAEFNAVREQALAWSPRRRENYQRYLASSRRVAQPDYLPVRLDIENVSRCNFRCVMCIVSDWPKGRRAEDMSVADFRRLIDEQYGLVEIKLNGLGEALLQGDDFFEMIRYARSQQIWVRMVTNASLLHLKENGRKLIDSGVNEVHISIDGADAAVFTQIRRGAVFDQIKENCTRLNAYCRDLGIKRTKMWTVVQAANCHQLPALVDLAAEMGFPGLALSLNLHGWGHDDLLAANRERTVEDSLDPDALHALVAQATAHGMEIGFWSVGDKYAVAPPEKLCAWPFERAVVTSDLRTVPCCMIGDPDAFEIGKGSGESFSTLWTSRAYQDFRQAHLDGDIPKVCRNCYRHQKDSTS